MSLSREAASSGGGGDAGQEIKDTDIHEPKAVDPIGNLGPFPKIARRQLESGDIDVDSDSEPDSDYDNIPRTSTPLPKQNSPGSPLVASRSRHTTSTLPSGPWSADTDMQDLKSVSSRRVKILGPFHIARCRLESGDIDVHPDSDDDILQNRRAWGSSSARHDIRRQQKISQPPQLIECRDGPPPPRPKFGVAAAKSVVADDETREIPESSSAMKSMFLPCRTCQLRKVGGRLECEHFLNGGSICESTSSINKAEDPLVGVGRKFGVPKIVGNESEYTYPKTLIVTSSSEQAPDQPVTLGPDIDEPTSDPVAPAQNTNETERSTLAYSHMMDSTDGEACFPSSSSFNTASFDPVSDVSDDETEDLDDEDSEYPSNGSTYGSTNDADSDDDGEFDDSETEAGSVDSYDMVDVDVDWSDESGFQSHAGDNNNSNNKGKRKAAANDQGCGGFSRRKGGEDDANGRRKRQKGGNNSRPNRSFEEEGEDEEKRPLACPYYKNNPQEQVDCVEWSDRSLSRVKAHVLRGHLKPIQCDRCGKYRAGDNGQIRTHLRNSNCEKPARFIPVDERIVQMGDDLKKSSGKARTWKQVYMILFECEEEDVPSPYLEASPLPEAPVEGISGSPIPQTSTQNVQATLSDAGFVQFAQEILTRSLADRIPALIAERLPELIANELPQIIAAYSARMQTTAPMAPLNPQRHQETRQIIPASQGVRQNQASASSFYSPPFPSQGASVQTSRSWHATGRSHSVVSTQYLGQPVVERTQCYSGDSHRMQNGPPVIEDCDLGFFENPEDGDLDAGDFFDDQLSM